MAVFDSVRSETGFNKTAVILGGLAAVLVIFALSLFLRGGFLAAQSADLREKEGGPQDELLATTRMEQQARLNETPRWLDEGADRLVMPIDDAKTRLVELQQEKQAETP